jgi:hypothetical protein
MENLTTSPEQAKNNQASNKQPKKTWVEPELLILKVSNGQIQTTSESYLNYLVS